jgi:hypothetical protein
VRERFRCQIGLATGFHSSWKELPMGRGILLWLLGVPIPIILLILLFWN